MIVNDIVEVLEDIAPLDLAAEWDNVGLLIGRGDDRVKHLMLTIDLTIDVLKEAREAKADLIVSYHPPIFEPLRSLTEGTPSSRIALETARAGVAVYSPHTALDAAPNGLNDWLASAVGDGDVRALESHASIPPTESFKIVTFAPADAIRRIREALAATGAGRIGAYTLCSFELAGTGTFLGGPATSPRIGRSGALERVDEVRLEMVCSEASLPLAIETLRLFHPYEEPPTEIYQLCARPQRQVGAGRRVLLDRAVPLAALVERLKRRLGVGRLWAASGEDAPRRFGTIGLCAGSGGSLRPTATAQGCELFVTGEMRHHDVLAAQASGCTILLAGHTNTERGYLKVLKRRLSRRFDGVSISISRRDRDPLREI